MSFFYIRVWVDGSDIVSVSTGEGPITPTGNRGGATIIDAVGEGDYVDAGTLRPTLTYQNNVLSSSLVTLYPAKDVTSLFANEGFTGQAVYNWTDDNLYQWQGNPWGASSISREVARAVADESFTVNIGADSIPDAPNSLGAAGGIGQINLFWLAPTANTDGSPLTDFLHYNIYRNTVNDFETATLLASSAGTTYVDAGLGYEETYYYWVTTVDLSGNESAESNSATSTTDFISAADMVADIRQQIDAARIDVVSVLPSGVGYEAGDFVFLETDKKLYQFDGTSWSLAVTAVQAVDISGQLQTNQIALDAVTNALIANNAVQTENIANLAINADKIASAAITTSKIAADAITSAQLADGAATAAVIATNAITETKIASNAITSPKISAGAITAGKLAAGSVQAGNIAAGAVTAGTIAANAVTANEIAANAVTASEISAGSITTAKIATGAVTATQIASQTITASQIATGTITTTQIATDTITSNNIASNAITANEIAANAVTTVALAANSVTADELTANSVIAGKIAAGAVSADKIAVNDLAAITANLGAVTAGSINTVSSGIGLQVNIPARPNAVYTFQNSLSTYGLFSSNVAFGGGTMEIQSSGGFTGQFLNSSFSSGAFGPFVAVNAQNTGSGGGHGQVGVSLAGGGYAFRSVDGGFYDVSGDGYNPFTGRHDGMILKGAAYALGDIVADTQIIVAGLSDSFTEVALSSEANQPGAVGVIAKVFSEWYIPAAFVDSEASRTAQEGHVSTPTNPMAPIVTTHDIADYKDTHDMVNVNSVGEGSVNVCGEGGDIARGDLIVASSTPGKGMKQADDIVRSYTVAKAREAVSFTSPDEIKMVACIYLCG